MVPVCRTQLRYEVSSVRVLALFYMHSVNNHCQFCNPMDGALSTKYRVEHPFTRPCQSEDATHAQYHRREAARRRQICPENLYVIDQIR